MTPRKATLDIEVPAKAARQSMKASLTERFMKSLKATGKRFRISDTGQKGLCVHVGEGGAKTWQVRVPSVVGASQVWETIGPYPGISCKEARKRARDIWSESLKGGNVRQALQAKRHAKSTIAVLGKRWLKEYVLTELAAGTYRSYKEKFEAYVIPKFGSRLPNQVDAAAVRAWHKGISSKGIAFLPRKAKAPVEEGGGAGVGKAGRKRRRPVPHQAKTAADAALRTVSSFFSWAIEEHLAKVNPARDVSQNGSRKIHRPLDSEGRRQVGAAIRELMLSGKANPIYLKAIQLIQTTGLRRESISKIRWDDVDFEEEILLLEDKAQRTQGTKAHPLGSPSIAILKSIPRINDSPFVFPGEDTSRHVSPATLNYVWDKVRKLAGVVSNRREIDRDGGRVKNANIRLHDTRHTKGAVAGNKHKNTMTAAIMGLATDQMADRYCKPIDKEVAKANEAIEREIAEELGIAFKRKGAVKRKNAGLVAAPEAPPIIIQVASWPPRPPRQKKPKPPAPPKVLKGQPKKAEWPAKEVLEQLVLEKPVTEIAKGLGVSDKAVEKHCRKLGIEKPGRGYWARVRASQE